MKAAYFEKHGNPDVLQFGDMDDPPKPKRNEILVQVKLASINHVDIWVRKGIPAYPVELPHVLGADGAGVIKDLGSDVEDLSIDNRVVLLPSIRDNLCGYCRSERDNQCDHFEILGTKRWGTYGQFVVVPSENVMVLPDNMPFEEGATFSLTYLTAWHMLFHHGKAKSGESVLVTGGGSGVGIAALNLAKMKGMKIFASTTSPAKVKAIKEAGAMDVWVQGGETSLSSWIHEKTEGEGVNIVIDPIGGTTLEDGIKCLTRYGRLVNCGTISGTEARLDLRRLFSKDLSLIGSRMGTHREFSELAVLIFIGRIKPKYDKIFPLQEAAQAHKYVESGQHTGKVLLRHPD